MMREWSRGPFPCGNALLFDRVSSCRRRIHHHRRQFLPSAFRRGAVCTNDSVSRDEQQQAHPAENDVTANSRKSSHHVRTRCDLIVTGLPHAASSSCWEPEFSQYSRKRHFATQELCAPHPKRKTCTMDELAWRLEAWQLEIGVDRLFRHELFRGNLTHVGLEASEASLEEFIKARINTNPHLGGLIATQS
jgi:hypothetical protein